MIGKQLDLFGGPPMPPRKIRVEEDEQPPIDPDIAEPIQVQEQEPAGVLQEIPEQHKPMVSAGDIFVQLPGPAHERMIIFTAGNFHEPDNNEVHPESTMQYPPAAEGGEALSHAAQDALPVSKENEGQQAGIEFGEAASDIGAEQEPHMVLNGPAWQQEVYEAGGMQDNADEAIKQEEQPQQEKEKDQPDAEAIGKIAEEETDAVDNRKEPEQHDGTDVGMDNVLPVGNKARQKAEQLGNTGLNIPDDKMLFSRQYYTMRETAAMFNVNQSLLRFWENEFDLLKPKKNRKGDRYFRPEDIRNLELIYHLLRVRKFTIEGAREYIRSRSRLPETFEMVQRLEKLKLFLQELKTSISRL